MIRCADKAQEDGEVGDKGEHKERFYINMPSAVCGISISLKRHICLRVSGWNGRLQLDRGLGELFV